MTCPSKDNRDTPILSSLQIAAPCSADWETMVGTERERFCSNCALNVYNISSMSESEAEQFLAARAGSRVCVQFFRRKDGTILSDNCPKGLRAIRDRGRQLFKIASSLAAVFLSTIFGAAANEPKAKPGLAERGEPIMKQPTINQSALNQPLMGKPTMAPAVDPKILQKQLQTKISELKSQKSTESRTIELARAHNDLAQSFGGCSNFKEADEHFSQAGKLLKNVKSQKSFYANVLLNQAALLRQNNHANQAKVIEAQAAKLTN